MIHAIITDYLSDPLFEEHRKSIIDELRKHNYHISGFYHRGGEFGGVPIFDDEDWFKVFLRTWGQIMADAYPEEMTQAKSAYNVLAWCSPSEPKDMTIPRKEDYPKQNSSFGRRSFSDG